MDTDEYIKNLSQQVLRTDASGMPPNEIFSGLAARERLGSTGLNNGIAIPHGRASGLKRPCAAFAKLVEPVDYGAPDGAPVDLALAVLFPDGDESIAILALTAEILSDPQLQSKLRECNNSRTLHEMLIATANQWQENQP